MDLKALILHIKSKLSGYIFSIPLHEGSIDIENLFAVGTNNLSLESFGGSIEGIKLIILADIDLADDTTFYQQGKAAIDRGPGNSIIQTLGITEQLFGSKMTFLSEESLKYPSSLPGHA